MVFLVSVKNDADHINNESARVLTTLNINIQGQLTPQSEMGSGLKRTYARYCQYGCPFFSKLSMKRRGYKITEKMY